MLFPTLPTLVLFLTAVLMSGRAAADAPPAPAPARGACAPSDGLHYICGPSASEDLVQVPGTHWLIASGMNIGRPAHLYLIDARTRRSSIAFPLDQADGDTGTKQRIGDACSGPPDPLRMSLDGLALRAGTGGMHTLYAANHGDRKAVEMFAVGVHAGRPSLRWIDCAPLPAGTLPNAVATLPDGGLLAISFYDPTDPSAWDRMGRGEPTGRILQWHAGSVFTDLVNGRTSGGNGLETSADGSLIYASAWSARTLVVISRTEGTRRDIPLDFMPDNIHRLADGSLLVTGQRTTVAAVHACTGALCPQPWVIARVDPHTGAVHELLSRHGTSVVSYACGAVILGDTVYITVRGEQRIAYAQLPGAPVSH